MNPRQYFFISGLPRSGSTLLSAILRQNPRFYADIASPTEQFFDGIINTASLSENHANIDAARRVNMLHAVMDSYYQHLEQPVVFDSSRGWTSRTSLLRCLWPKTRILCCVRDVRWILDSFERLVQKNSLYTNTFVDNEARPSVETRCQALMDVTKDGQVIKPLKWLQEGLAANPDMIMLIEYDSLCKYPRAMMSRVYKFLDQPEFNHDFDNVSYQNPLYDNTMGAPDLHTVRLGVSWKPRTTILPAKVWDTYSEQQPWQSDTVAYD